MPTTIHVSIGFQVEMDEDNPVQEVISNVLAGLDLSDATVTAGEAKEPATKPSRPKPVAAQKTETTEEGAEKPSSDKAAAPGQIRFGGKVYSTAKRGPSALQKAVNAMIDSWGSIEQAKAEKPQVVAAVANLKAIPSQVERAEEIQKALNAKDRELIAAGTDEAPAEEEPETTAPAAATANGAAAPAAAEAEDLITELKDLAKKVVEKFPEMGEGDMPEGRAKVLEELKKHDLTKLKDADDDAATQMITAFTAMLAPSEEAGEGDGEPESDPFE